MAKQKMVGGASSYSSAVSLEKYDVFLSFRGVDTRANFTSHLYDALTGKQVKTFIDDKELRKGDELSPALVKAIEESHASIIIFSENYADSKWCLNELIKILECKKDRGHVIPVFHNIDPADVRKQNGSYKKAFAKHERDLKLNKDKLQTWKAALTKAADLSGWDSRTYETESDLIKKIVKDVLGKLKHSYPYEVKEGLVGIEKKCEEIESSFLKIGSNDVRILGIWGMGGIGKTTLAKALCARLCSQFECYCFLENVREESITVVRHRLFSALLEEENLRLDALHVEAPSIMRRLERKKVFLVLDNVVGSEQIKHLFINNNCLGPGSRVIVTTRDKQICSQFDECVIYEMKGLNKHDSLQLFCLNALKKKHPKNGYEELSECVIGYCNGNPLALEVLGANLHSKSKEVWKSGLKKLQEIPHKTIQSVLKLSYDDLDRVQKTIFLDMACFLKGWSRAYVTRLLEACNSYAAICIEDLLEKALITISDFEIIEMHDLIKEMGREIVNQESEDPGKRSRLWKAEEVHDILRNNKGTEDVEFITFNICEAHRDLYLSSDSFKRMTNLRFLEIYDECVEKIYKVHFRDGGLGWLSDKLRYLRWDAFSLESLPSTFSAEMLVEVHMNRSKLKKLWHGVQNVFNLKIIDLSYSEDLIEVPDLSRATNLEALYLEYCESLRKLHPSILSLPKLTRVDLIGCKNIKSLKSNIHSKSLRELCLKDCSSLTEFSVTSEEMSYLNLDGCKKLNIVGMKLSGLGSLTGLNLSRCTQINVSNLRFILNGLRSLYELYLTGCCNLEALPDNIQNHPMLKRLYLNDCRKLVFSLTELPPSLQHLTAANCTYLHKDSTQCPVLVNMLLQTSKLKFDNRFRITCLFLPGGQVPPSLHSFKFDFHITTEAASITIPPIPKSHVLCGFFFCIILSEGLDLSVDYRSHLFYRIHTNGKLVGHHTNTMSVALLGISSGILISDHVLLSYHLFHKPKSGSDLYNGLSFEFKLQCNYKKRSTEGIKGCGVLPLYALERGSELDGNSSRQEIVELESGASAQVFDIGDSLQPTAIGGNEEVGGSINENEDDQQQPSYSPKEEEDDDLNEKSYCNCSIGLLLKHLLGGSKQ